MILPIFLKVSFKEIIHIQKLKTPLFPIYARSIENHRFKNNSELVYYSRHISVLALSHWGGLHGLTKSSRHCSLVSSTRTNVSYNHSTTKQEWCTQVFIAEEEEEAWPRVWPLQDPDPCPMLPKKRTLQKKFWVLYSYYSSMFFLNRWIWWWELDSVANK